MLRIVTRSHGVIISIEVALITEVIITNNLLKLGGSVSKVCLWVKPLCEDSYVVVKFGCFHLAVNSSDVNFFLVDHDHHLPFTLILAYTSELWSSESVFSHIVMWSLWLLSNQDRIWGTLIDSIHDLCLLLKELVDVHVLLYLSFESDESWCTFIFVFTSKSSLLVECGAKITLTISGIQSFVAHDIVDKSILFLIFLWFSSWYGIATKRRSWLLNPHVQVIGSVDQIWPLRHQCPEIAVQRIWHQLRILQTLSDSSLSKHHANLALEKPLLLIDFVADVCHDLIIFLGSLFAHKWALLTSLHLYYRSLT